jgi:DNA replication protein DnaC
MGNRPARPALSGASLRMIGVPEKFHSFSLGDFDANKLGALARIKDFVAGYIEDIDGNFSKNMGILFYGSNGTGKTTLASIVIREAYRLRYTARRVTFVEYIDRYAAGWGKSAGEREVADDEFYTYYKSVEFLCLEEVGKEIDSKIAAPILEDCLRYREDRRLVTIACTNLSPGDLCDRYGQSVHSLLTGNMTPIQMDFMDKRQKAFGERG